MTVEAGADVPLKAQDRYAIYDLKSDYFYNVDNRRWPELRALFTDDAEFDGFPFVCPGPDDFVAGCDDIQTGARSAHQGFMPRLVAQSEDLVRGRWTMYDYMTWEPGSKVLRGDDSADLSGIHGYGYYEETYRREARGWRIASLRLTRLRIERVYGPQAATFEGTPPTIGWLPLASD